jgi:hypothetical protein
MSPSPPMKEILRSRTNQPWTTFTAGGRKLVAHLGSTSHGTTKGTTIPPGARLGPHAIAAERSEDWMQEVPRAEE